MDYREQILDYMRMQGPVLPVHVAKIVGKEIMFASAMLSEMASKNLIRISNLKIGGSPVYYLPEHADRLQNYLSNYGAKEQAALERLKQLKVLRDSDLEPLDRMIYQTFKDFAIAITVKREHDQQLFWKWYLCSDEDARQAIILVLDPPKQVMPATTHPVTESSVVSMKRDPVKADTKSLQAKPKAKEQQTTIAPTLKPVVTKTKKKVSKPSNVVKSTLVSPPAAIPQAPVVVSSPVIPPVVTKVSMREPVVQDSGVDTHKQVRTLFEKNKIKIIRRVTPRDRKDLDCVVTVPSGIGSVTMYCRLLVKKKIADSDITAAWVEAGHYHLPLLLLVEGQIMQAVRDRIERDFPGIVVKDLEVKS